MYVIKAPLLLTIGSTKNRESIFSNFFFLARTEDFGKVCTGNKNFFTREFLLERFTVHQAIFSYNSNCLERRIDTFPMKKMLFAIFWVTTKVVRKRVENIRNKDNDMLTFFAEILTDKFQQLF
jgi:hypothetical protein